MIIMQLRLSIYQRLTIYLKPIEIEKLRIAVDRLRERLKLKELRANYTSLMENLQEKTVQNIVFPHKGQHKKPSFKGYHCSRGARIIYTYLHKNG